MNPADWCPLHGSDGDVCDCRVEPEPVVIAGLDEFHPDTTSNPEA